MKKPSSAEGSGQYHPDEPHADKPLKFSTGKSQVEQDTVLQSLKQTAEAPKTPLESYATPSTSESSVSAYTNSEVRFRLFPRESGHPVESPLPDASGISLGHFRIKDRIGTGGMGAVFRAVDERLQRVVALKVLSPTQLHQPDSIQRFRNEARSAAMLDHDNIARVFYVGEEKGVHFIANEFVIGENIRDLIQQQGRLKIADAVNYTIQVAMALNHTSAAGVIHRDIKPSNIIVTPAGRAKLVDLGLARKESTESTNDLTEAGTTLGTFDYIAPEQAKDPRFVDVRSDIYSLGCSLYHMLTGEPPYAGGSALQKLLEHQASTTPDPADKVASIPPQLSQVVKKMMASDINERYSTPYQIINDLNGIAPLIGMQENSLHSSPFSRQRSKQPPRWEAYIGWILASVLLVALVIGLDIFSNTQNSIPDSIETDSPAVQDTSENVAVIREKNPALAIDPGLRNTEPSELAETPVVSNSDSKPENSTLPAKIEPQTSPQKASQPFVVVGDNMQEVGFRLLSEACEAASDGSVIEIQDASQQTILVQDIIQIRAKSLTLKAKNGERPQLQFSTSAEIDAFSNANISINQAASLKLYNLDLRFVVDTGLNNTVPTLFALIGEQNELQLKNCSVTVVQKNETDDEKLPVNVFKFHSPNNVPEIPRISLSSRTSKLRISDSFVRGDARFCTIESSRPSSVDVSESVIAMSDSIINLENEKQDIRLPQWSFSQNTTSDTHRLSFKQSTILIAEGAFLDRTSKPNAFVETHPIELTGTDNVFATRNSNVAFVSLRSTQDELDQTNWKTELTQQFRWQGSHNFYSQFKTYLELATSEEYAREVQPFQRLKFDEWNELWSKTPGRRSSSLEVEGVWQADWQSKPFAELRLSELKLSGQKGKNLVKPSISEDRQDVGAPIQQLIELDMRLDSSVPMESGDDELSE